MYSDHPRYNTEAGRSTSKYPQHVPQKLQAWEERVDRNGKMLSPHISHKSHIGTTARRGPQEKAGQKKDALQGYQTRYRSSSPPSPPLWSPPMSPIGSIHSNHYPERSPNSAKSILSYEEQRVKSYPIVKIHKKSRRHLTRNQKRILKKSSQKAKSPSAKQHRKRKRKLLKKINKQKAHLAMKDSEVTKMVSEVKRLKKDLKMHMIQLRSNKLMIVRHRKYIHDISETRRRLQKKNMAIKGLVSGLPDLRRENQQQKELIAELAFRCKNYGELVLLLREAETMNESLQRMVRIEASSNPQYPGEHEGFLPRSHSVNSSLKSPNRQIKPLNPHASCFKSATDKKWDKIQLTDDEWAKIRDQIGTPNKSRKTEKNTIKAEEKKTNIYAEMKRKFAEACIEGPLMSSKALLKAKIDVVKEKHNGVAVKVSLPVLVLKSPPSPHQQPVVADKVLESTLSSHQHAAESVSNMPDENIFDHDDLKSSSPSADKEQFNQSPKVEDRSSTEEDAKVMSLPVKDNRKPGIAHTNQGDCGTEDARFLVEVPSIQDKETIDQTCRFENLY